MQIPQLCITEFDYALPPEQIAFFPSATRESARLLHYVNGSIRLTHFTDLPSLQAPDTLMVFNETKVIESRLVFHKPSGGRIEIFCLEPVDARGGLAQAMQQQASTEWYGLIGGAAKWKKGTALNKVVDRNGDAIALEVHYIRKEQDRFVLSFRWSPATYPFADILEAAGEVPLPPYIKRPVAQTDKDRYQTVYAKYQGSVAAPTAGLHFTPSLLQQLQAKNIATGFLTLHVGAGTFKPVQAATIAQHNMHTETFRCSLSFLQQLEYYLAKSITAVGTTSLRTLESLYWLGVKAAHGHLRSAELSCVSQWEAYAQRLQQPDAKTAIAALIHWMEQTGQTELQAQTQLLIAPGYTFRITDQLITNFHQPRSTLLLLIAAFVGEDWKKIYAAALDNGLRFLSYGDSSLLAGNRLRPTESQG